LEHVRHILALALLAAACLAQDLASVKGIVSNAVTGEPLRKAYVRLHPATGSARPATTDEQGQFLFENLKPGIYKLDAEHVGFLDSQLADAAGTSVELRLAAGEAADVNVRMTPQGAISGRVVDADGDPWVHASVALYRSVFKQGKRRLDFMQSGDLLDDQGRFRVAALAPGTYYVKAEPQVDWEISNRLASEEHLQPTWYPSSFEKDGSTPIVVSAGQEFSGAEIRLRRAATYRIRGTVSGLESPQLSPRGAANRMVGASLASEGGGSNHTGRLQPDGSFEIQGVASGEYEVGFAQGIPPANAGRVRVRVDGRDLDGVAIEVSQTHPVKGTVRFEGKASNPLVGLPMFLTRVDSDDGQRFTRTLEDGNFEFPSVLTGRYRIWLTGNAAGQYYLKTLRYEGAESRMGIVALTDGAGPLELVLSTRGAHLAVNLKQEDGRAKGVAARVVLIPDTDDAEERGFGTLPAVRDQNGVYTIGNIPAGAYRLLAFESVPDGAWIDAEFWKEVSSRGVQVGVGEGEYKSAEVPLVPRAAIAALLTRLGIE
jgi:hypothetical protein